MPKETKPGGKAAEPKPTPSAETPPETPVAETPAPTPEEIDAQAEELMAAAFGTTSSAVNLKIQEARENGEETEPEPAAEEPAGDTPPAEPSPAPEPETEPAAAAPAERFVPGAPTAEDVRRIAREEIEQNAEEEPATEPAPAPALDDETLPDAARDQLMVIEEMARLNPAHRDLPTRQRTFWKKEDTYRAKWEQANPGVAYDPNADDHSTFYRQNEPFVPARDFKTAERSLISRVAEERAEERVMKKIEPKLQAIELKEREREAAPAIANSMADAAEDIFAAAPQFKDAFKPKELTKAAMEKMEEINPVLAQIAREEADRTVVLVKELERLDRLQAPVDPQKRHTLSNGKVILPHAELEVEFSDCEQALLGKPEAERTRDGKKLIRFDEATARAQRIRDDAKLTPIQRQRAFENLKNSFWWVQSGDVRKHIISKSQARVVQFADRFPKGEAQPAPVTALNGHHANGQPAATPKPAPATVKPSGKAGLQRGTATSSVSDTANNAPKDKTEAEKNREMLERAAFR